jgi:hypothetical protein
MRCVLGLLAVCGSVLLTPEIAHALVRIDIDLSSQRMHVASDSGALYDWPISSGRAGHLTPRGAFRPIALYPMVRSFKYGNAPMPHSIFFHGQFAIHGTTAVGILGRQASHGCVRLAPAQAAALYAMVRSEGAAIRISGSGPDRGSPVARHGRNRASAALAYALQRRARTLREWARDPFNDE